MKQILIKFPDTMEDEDAMSYVKTIIERGKVSNLGRDYCHLSVYKNGLRVELAERTKYPTFLIYHQGMYKIELK